MISKGSSQQRTDDAGKSIGSPNDAGEGRTLLGRRGKGNDGVGTGTNAGSTETSDGSAGDEGFSVGGGAADDGAELEDDDGEEEGCLERKILVCLSPWTSMLAWECGADGRDRITYM